MSDNPSTETTVPQLPTSSQILRFVIPSAFGVAIFLMPVWWQGQLNIPLGIFSTWLAGLIKPFAPVMVCAIVVASAILACLAKAFPNLPLFRSDLARSLFDVTPMYLVVRVVGAAIAVMCVLGVGPEFVISGDTGGTMLGLLGTLVAWFFAASFLIPLLMQYGIMEFVGTWLRDFTQPLFRIPGRATVDLLASWVGNCNVGVVLTTQQYEHGFYTAREAVLIATCFSASSLPFCLVIAAMLGVDADFFLFYLVLVVTGIVSVIIMCRIPILSTFSDEYYEGAGKRIRESDRPDGLTKTQWALVLACQAAQEGPGPMGVIRQGIEVFANIVFVLTPTVMCYGTIALAIATYTPVFQWLSLPFGYYLQFLGVQEAFAAAPGTIAGFVDMLIPALLCANIASYQTRFIIGVLSLVQIVYMTEVGTLMLTSKLPIKLWQLVVIFLEKTVIALPVIVMLTRLLGV